MNWAAECVHWPTGKKLIPIRTVAGSLGAFRGQRAGSSDDLSVKKSGLVNHLVLVAHPNPSSFCLSICGALRDATEACGGSFRLRDLYQQPLDPILAPADFIALAREGPRPDVVAEQELLRWAQLISVVYPIWWAGPPAVLKGYYDRVLTNGFAFRFVAGVHEPLLTGRRVLVFNTLGATVEEYQASGMLKSLSQTSDEGVFGFCGLDVAHHYYCGSIPSASAEVLAALLEEVREIARTACQEMADQ